ncbi:hypothetical protein [Moheibacter sediminis]|uniref:YD repeat-containing protein n=1 Tax=Moheibacter sediminis TaxID=1434700 RepID=A0A1W1ZRB3_9FLAO|nr:hypothetical protein [Moheibacter sediminis]SMC50936.1 hypothetical protein SAMN06296427_103174 [Moheibacter sediminis]
MKKLFFLFTSAIFMISCSNDDGSSPIVDEPAEPKIYIKKIINVALADSDGTTETFLVDFEYEGNQLKKIISGNGYTELEYLNGKIVSYANYSDGNINSSGELVYNGELLTHTLADDSGYKFRIDYTYSNDGKLKRTQQCSGTEPCTNNNSYTEFTFQNDNIVQEVNSMVIFGTPTITTYNYTYDDKKNPFTNYDEVTRILLKDMVNAALSKNNYTSQTDYNGSLINYTNTYTEDDYLKKHEGRYDSNGSFYVSFEYEYTEL